MCKMRRLVLVRILVLVGVLVSVGAVSAANTIRGVLYDTDGITPLTTVAVNINVTDSKGTCILAKCPVNQSLVDGSYVIMYDPAKLQADKKLMINYTRNGSTTVTSMPALSGMATAHNLNPIVP